MTNQTVTIGRGKAIHINDGSNHYTYCGKGFGTTLIESGEEATCKTCINSMPTPKEEDTVTDPRTTSQRNTDARVIKAALPTHATLLDHRPTAFAGEFVILAVVERPAFTEFVCWYATDTGVSMGVYADDLETAQAAFARRQSC